MEYKDFTKEQAADALASELIDYLMTEDRDNGHVVLKSYLQHGFAGFETRSDEDLAEEWRRVFGEDDSEEPC